MAKDKLTDYDSTASGNLDVGGVSVAEGMLPSGVNNAIRELMSHQADAFGAGTPLYVDQTNNRVGVRTASPATDLHIKGAGGTSLRLEAGNGVSFTDIVQNQTNTRLDIKPDGTTYLSVDNNGDISFYDDTGTTQGLFWDASAEALGIGTTSVIGGSASFNLKKNSDGWVSAFQVGVNGNFGLATFNATGSNVGGIIIGASATTYSTSSDYRLKTAVNYDWDATTRLKQLKPARFEWIADGDNAVPVDGFLAHEVQDIVPEAISGEKDAMRDEEYTVSAATGDIYTPSIDAVIDDDGNEVTPAVAEVIHSTDAERPEELAEGQQWRETTAAVMGTRSVPDYQGIDQSKLVPLLVKTIQELEARIVALENA